MVELQGGVVPRRPHKNVASATHLAAILALLGTVLWAVSCLRSRASGERRPLPLNPHGEHLGMASEKEEMRHAGECVRLAGLTDDIAVRDQLVELAEGWISTAHRDRRSAQVITLYPRQSSRLRASAPRL
jgi:hypothetical protein